MITSLYDATPGRLFIIHHQNTCGLVQTSFTVGKAPWLAQFHEHGSSALAWEGVVLTQPFDLLVPGTISNLISHLETVVWYFGEYVF